MILRRDVKKRSFTLLSSYFDKRHMNIVKYWEISMDIKYPITFPQKSAVLSFRSQEWFRFGILTQAFTKSCSSRTAGLWVVVAACRRRPARERVLSFRDHSGIIPGIIRIHDHHDHHE